MFVGKGIGVLEEGGLAPTNVGIRFESRCIVSWFWNIYIHE